MSEGKKEQIKHLANYFNGLAIVFFAGGVLAPFVTFVGEGPLWRLMMVVVIGTGLSFALHRVGNQLLRQIDR